MKKPILLIGIASLLCLFSCSKKSNPTPPNNPINGTWYADSVNSKVYTGANLTSNTTQTYNRSSYKFVYSFGTDTGYYVTSAAGVYNLEQFDYSNDNNSILYLKYQNGTKDTAQVKSLSDNKMELQFENGSNKPTLSYNTFYFSK